MPISTAATNLFMFLTLVAWTAAGGFLLRWEVLRGNWFVYSLATLFLMVCIGALYSSGTGRDIGYQIYKYGKFLFILPAITLLQDDVWRKRGINAFLIAMTITLFLSLASAITPLAIVKGTATGPSNNHFVFRDHIAQNLMMSFFVLIALSRFLMSEKRSTKVLYFCLAALGIFDILFLVLGRTGYISLALNLLVFLIFLKELKQKIFASVMLLLLAFVTLHYSSGFNTRVNIALDEYRSHQSHDLSSVGQRLEFVKKSFELIKEKPLFGHGTGSQRKELCRVAESPMWCDVGQIHPHNQFMAIGIQLGLMGLAGYVLLFGLGVRQAFFQSKEYQILALGLVATLLADSLFHAPLTLIAEAAIFLLLFPLVLAKSSESG